MTIDTGRDTPATSFRLGDDAKIRLRSLKEQYRMTQTEIINAALLQFDYARYRREQAEQAERQAA
jgi:predicted transcriptional regulator